MAWVGDGIVGAIAIAYGLTPKRPFLYCYTG